MRGRPILAVVCLLVLLGFQLGVSGMAARLAERRFEFTYQAKITGFSRDAQNISIWLPYPVNDEHQEITDLKVSSAYPVKIGKDPEYGNSMLYISADHPGDQSIAIEMKFRVKRREYIRRNFRPATARSDSASDPMLKRWLEPDRLVPVDDHIKSLAREVTKGLTTDLEKARAIYAYTVTNLKYDKSGTGWGRGDIYYACDVKRGNCTDFHAVFIGFCRAVGIPAKFAIGFPLPAGRGQGQIAGYHCWAEFYLKTVGWVPVDTSEASKNPAKREYFFGAHDENRVQLTIGRDLRLSPRQAGGPINFFIYPYVEVDGEPFDEVEKTFFFKDVTSE